jgi:hypothetical protein
MAAMQPAMPPPIINISVFSVAKSSAVLE